MTDDLQEFLQKIINDPSDEVARLVLSDYVLEHPQEGFEEEAEIISEVLRRDGWWIIREESNPTYDWGLSLVYRTSGLAAKAVFGITEEMRPKCREKIMTEFGPNRIPIWTGNCEGLATKYKNSKWVCDSKHGLSGP